MAHKAPRAPRSYDVFLSYSRRDNEAPASREGPVDLIRELISRPDGAALSVFFDRLDIRDYDDWRDRILEELRRCEVLLVVLSPNYFASAYCQWEWDHYVYRSGARGHGSDGASIASVLLHDTGNISADKQAWHESVRSANTLDLRHLGGRRFSSRAFRSGLSPIGERLRDALRQRIRRAQRVDASGLGLAPQAIEHFTGRRALLRHLHEHVGAGRKGALVVLHGLDGMGKTELALFYAREYAYCYSGGKWFLNASGFRDLRALIAGLAERPEFPRRPTDAERRNVETQYEFVLNVLAETARTQGLHNPEAHSRVLLILDNVDNVELLGSAQRKRLPVVDWLCVLATSGRFAESWKQAVRLTPILVDVLDRADAKALVRALQPGHAFRSVDDESAADELTRDLAGYTLAVEQA